jgi:L-2,4-diaminobutyrate decarboxylase
MNSLKLSKVYNAEDFKKQANSTVELLSNHLSNAINGKGKAIPYKDAETEYQFWNDFEFTSAENFFENVLDRSVRTHHKKYMGHQVGATAPLSAIAGLVSSFLNNGSAVYEMGMANNAIERIVF